MRGKFINNVSEKGHDVHCSICGKEKRAIMVEVGTEGGRVLICNLSVCKECFGESSFLKNQFCVGQGID
jgi:formate dehydrogenase maturation protein FdhE